MAAENKLDFVIAAHIQGMEQLSGLINRVSALEKETQRLRTANAGLSTSTDAVIRQGVRYNNALDAQSKQLRQNRQGTQQLGMQINDFATSVSTGASPIQAFNQQLGQLGYAMSMMGGVAGRVGGFLAGPWGAMIVMATALVGPMIERFFSAKSAAEAMGDGFRSAADEARGLIGAMNALALNEARIKRNKTWDALAEKENLLQTGRRSVGSGGTTIYAKDAGFFGMGQSEAQLQKEVFGLRQDLMRQENLIKIAEQGNKEAEALARKAGGGGRTRSGGGRAGGGENAAAKAAKEAQKINDWVFKKRVEGQKALDAEMDRLEQNSHKTTIDNLEVMYAGIEEMNTSFLEEMQRPFDELAKSFESIGNTVSDSFKGMLTGAMSWKDGMRGIINAVIDELWRLYVVQNIVGMVGRFLGGAIGGGSMVSGVSAGISRSAGDFFRASGGHVGANTPYIVGEKGPELFVPGGSGTIIPNKNMGGGGGGSVTINVDARGSADPAAVRKQVEAGIIQAAPAIIAAAEARTVASLRRPKLGGVMQ